MSAPSSEAFVLTCSGMNAAYEVGVMKALLRGPWGVHDNPRADPFCYSGTSVGAFNASVMVAQADRDPAEALDYLENLWIERIAVESASSSTGIFRVRAEPTQYLNSGTYVSNPLKPIAQMGADMLFFTFQALQRVAYATASANTLPDGAVLATELSAWIDGSPLQELVRESIYPGDIVESTKQLRLTALNWETGVAKIFENKDFDGLEGCDTLLAALAMPVMLQPQMVSGVPYVEASVLSDRPLRPAIRAARSKPRGPITLYTVYVDAQHTPIPLPVISNTFATVYRLYLLALSRSVHADIERAEMVNKRIRMLELLNIFADKQGKPLDEVIGELAFDAADVWKNLLADTRSQLPITVHRFRPSRNIRGFELKQFERRRIRQLIQDGYDDTLRHDCEANRCVLHDTMAGGASRAAAP